MTVPRPPGHERAPVAAVGPLARNSLTTWGASRRRRPKTSETIAQQILGDMVAEDTQPGTSLPAEATMMARYGAGRGSVREALRILEVHGLLTIKTGPGGGPVLNEVTP